MTEALKYISRFNSGSPLPGVLELYAQSFLCSALRELFGMGILKIADGWLWWSGSVQVALMPLTTSAEEEEGSGGGGAPLPPPPGASSLVQLEEPSSVQEAPPTTAVTASSVVVVWRHKARKGLGKVGVLLVKLLLSFLQSSDVVITNGATTFRDEVVGLAWLLIERSHLQSHSASMSEHFFGMKRAGIVRTVLTSSSLSIPLLPLSPVASTSSLSPPSPPTNNNNNTSSSSTQIVDHDCNKVFGSDVTFVSTSPPLRNSNSNVTTTTSSSSSLLMDHRQYLMCLFQLGVAPYLLGKLSRYFNYYTSDNPDIIEDRMGVVRGYLQAIEDAQNEERILNEVNTNNNTSLSSPPSGGGEGIVVESLGILAKVKASKRRAVMMAKVKYILYRTIVKILVTMFPLVNFANQGLRAMFLAAYALERTPYFTFLQRLGNVGIRRIQMQDRMMAQEGAKNSAGGSSAFQKFLLKAGAVSVPLMFIVVRYQSWRREQQQGDGTGGVDGEGGGEEGGASSSYPNDTRKVPPPIEVSEVPPAHSNNNTSTTQPGSSHDGPSLAPPLPPQSGRCPVCSSTITNPAVLIVSGTVGCFTCLHTYATDHKACPVTHRPCTPVHVRRLYE